MPTPRIIVLILAAVTLLFVAAACGSGDESNGGASPTPSSDRKTVDAPIDGLKMIVRESFPPQYAVRITSGLPDGCHQFEAAEIIRRVLPTITIHVTNTTAADPNTACAQVYGTHETVVELGSDFVSGTEYTVLVNDQHTTFTAQ
jgi:hypothetical protein